MADDLSKLPAQGVEEKRTFTINFGPQHPAAHGVLQLQRKIRREGSIER